MKPMCLCVGCNKELDPEETPCSNCQGSKRIITAEFNEKITLNEIFRIRQARIGFKKFMLEILQGHFSSINPHLSKGVFKRRLIDKQNDNYEEYVVDNKTGNPLRNVKEKLSEHRHN